MPEFCAALLAITALVAPLLFAWWLLARWCDPERARRARRHNDRP